MATRNINITDPGNDASTVEVAGLQIDIRVLESGGNQRLRLDCRMEGDPQPPGAKEGANIPAPIRRAIKDLIQAILDDKTTMLGI